MLVVGRFNDSRGVSVEKDHARVAMSDEVFHPKSSWEMDIVVRHFRVAIPTTYFVMSSNVKGTGNKALYVVLYSPLQVGQIENQPKRAKPGSIAVLR